MKILLVEDDVRTASFIKKGLKEAGCVVMHACNGEDGLHMALHDTYDVMILDIMLPKLDGLTIVNQMRQRNVKTPVIILSARNSVDDRVTGLQKGGDDYLTKPFAFAELLARIQALVRRATGTPETTRLSIGDLTMDILSREVQRAGTKIDLQPLEFSLLEYLMRHAGKIVSKTMIIENVWDYDFDPQTNIVETRISRLRDKIDEPFNKPLIHTFRGAGYVLKEKT